MKKEEIDFRKEEQCVCDGEPCSCSILKEDLETEKPFIKKSIKK